MAPGLLCAWLLEHGLHDVEVANLAEEAPGLANHRHHAVRLALARRREVTQYLAQAPCRHARIVHAVGGRVAKRGQIPEQVVQLTVEQGMR